MTKQIQSLPPQALPAPVARTARCRRPAPAAARRRLVAAAALALALASVAVPAMAVVEFPGPRTLTLTQAGSAIAGVRLPGRAADDLVVAHETGLLSLIRYSTTSATLQSLQQLFLEGRLVQVRPWEGRPLSQPGVVVAAADPDRVYFVAVAAASPYLTVVAAVDLEEDPGQVAWFGDVSGGDGWLGIALPGVDQVEVLADRGGWGVLDVVGVGDEPFSVAGADLDGDGRLELVVAQRGWLSGDLCVIERGPGDVAAARFAAVPGQDAGLVAALDLEGDGRSELLVADRGQPTLRILRPEGGGFTAAAEITTSLVAQSLETWVLAGGEPALIAGDPGRGALEFASLGEGAWTVHGAYFPGCRPLATALADVNGDGLPDAASVGRDASILTVMLARPGPGFWGPPSLALSSLPAAVAHLDLDADGRGDALVSSALGTRLTYFHGKAAGGLETVGTELQIGFVAGRIIGLQLDVDPRPELAVLDLLAGEVVIMDQDEGGALLELARREAGALPGVIEAGDVDGDGRVDLVTGPADGSRTVLLFGEADGSIGAPLLLDSPLAAHAVRPVDLDDDGDLDLVGVDGVSRVWWRQNLGARSFGAAAWLNAGNGATLLASGDLDGDGDLDIVVACRTDRSLTYFENPGNGSLVRRTGSRALDAEPTAVRTGDFDRDGRDDVAVVLRSRAEIQVYQNALPWNNEFGLPVNGTPDMLEFTIGDLNLDGTLDLLAVDGALQLGVAHLNVDPAALALEPDALAVDCRDGSLSVRLEPGAGEPWRLEARLDHGWDLLATAGGALAGRLEPEFPRWVLTLDAADLAGAGRPRELRLVVGDGADAGVAVAAVPAACAGGEAARGARPEWTAAPWPNPGNPLFHASFRLAAGGPVAVSVHDLAGRRLAVLHDGYLGAGGHDVAWDGRAAGRAVAAGTYLLRVATRDGAATARLVLVK